MLMGNGGQPFDVDDISSRIADRFAKNGASLIVDAASNSFVVVERNHARFNALARKAVSKQIVGTAIKLTGAYDILTSTGYALNGIGNCRHTGSNSERA